MKSDLATSRPRLVAIVGGSGAGKTWLGSHLQKALGRICARLCLDDFYRDRSHLSAACRARINFDHPRTIDWPLVERVFDHCLAGESVLLPRYDLAEHRRQPEANWWQPKPLVLVEGLWLLHRRVLRERFSLSIFLDCPKRLRFRRRLQRDVKERARTPESVRRQFQETVDPMHELFVVPQAQWADICISGGIAAKQLQGLIVRLEAILVGYSSQQ